jgi:Sporulation and spore germination
MAQHKRKRKTISLLIPFLVIALVFGVLLWNKYRASRMVAPTPQVQKPSGRRTVVLFFIGDGNRLAREARELEPCSNPTACVKEVLDELFSGPVGELDEALPAGSLLNSVRIEGNMVLVDVNRNFVEELPKGSSSEMLAVYSIVDTVCINFPQFSQVKLTVDGEGKSVLTHLDLSGPLSADYSLEQPTVQTPADKGALQSKPDKTEGKP